MAESGEISMKKWLDVAHNPIGSLALVERFDENEASLLRTFNILSPKIVDLILSPYGFRIVESFLKVDEVYVKLAESLSEEWSEFEQVLKTEKGRYVCETLLKKKMTLFAHKIITTAPWDWWLKNVDAVTILIKAITLSDVDVAKEFIFHEQMVIDMCDASEGLYCVLKVMSKWMDQPGWTDLFANLILHKSKSTAGCEALVNAIIYGDYLVNEIVEIICCFRESFDNSTTVSLIIRIIEQGSDSVKELIVKCICEPHGNPIFSQIRNTSRFEELKKACDSNFTLSQRKRLDDCMASTRICSVLDDCLTALTTNASDSMSAPDGQNKKRRSESQATTQSAAKKPREEALVSQPSSQITVPKPSTVSRSPSIITKPTPPESEPSTVAPASTVSIPPTVTTQHTVASSATVPIPTTTPSVKLEPMSASDRLAKKLQTDPGKDVISMAMSEKYSVILSKLEKGAPKLRLTVFNCIHNALLPLMMDERGSEVVKWFIVNGTVKQKEEIERKVEETIEDLVSNGGYGGAIAALVIENCADSEKKKELSDKSMKAMESARDFLSPTLATECDEIEIVGQKINKKPVEKSTVARPIGEPVSDKQPDQANTVAKVLSVTNTRPRYREVTFREEEEIRSMFDVVDHKLKQGTLSGADCGLFIKHAVRFAKDGISNLFIDLMQERVATWVTSDRGTRLLNGLTQKTQLRPHLSYTVASVLHLLHFDSTQAIVLAMLSKHSRHSFAYYCISKHDESPIVKLFRADMEPEHCLMMGMVFVKVYPSRMRDLLKSPTGLTIGSSENGRRFIELLAKPRPEGQSWFDLLDRIPATQIDRSPDNDSLAPNPATATVKIETEETASREKSSAEKQAITTTEPTVATPHTVASSQLDTVAAHVDTTAPSANDERWRDVLREENGVVSIVQGRYLSDEERLRINATFKMIDYMLKWRWPTPDEKQGFIACGVLKDGVSQLFLDKIREMVVSNPRWAHWMSIIAKERELRPYLIAPVASILPYMHLPSPLLETMLLKGTREAFVDACLDGNDCAPFVCLFKSDVKTAHCVEIGVQIAKAMPDRILAFLLSPLGRSIGETEKGREFFESLAKVLSTENRQEVAARSAVPFLLPIQSGFTPFGSNPFNTFPLPLPLPALNALFPPYRPPLINPLAALPFGVPSFPAILPHVPAQNFPFPGVNPTFAAPEIVLIDEEDERHTSQ